jgi:hypothetical protein
MLVYTQRKSGNARLPQLKVAHDTPPLRGFGLLVSRVLELPSSSPWKQLLNILGFGADIGRFQADLWSI